MLSKVKTEGLKMKMTPANLPKIMTVSFKVHSYIIGAPDHIGFGQNGGSRKNRYKQSSGSQATNP